MASTPDQQGPDIRAALVTAARSRFATVGFEASRLSDLCADAGLTTGALYRRFASKEALLESLLGDLDDDLSSVDDGDVGDVVAQWLTIVRRHRGAYRASVEQALTDGPFAPVRRRQRDELADRLRSALGGEPVAATVAADAVEYIALAEALGWSASRPPTEIGESLQRLLVSGIYGAKGQPHPAARRPDRDRGPRMAPVLSWQPAAGRTRPASRRGEAQVEAILDAAAQLFAELGVGRTTVGDVARRAGVSSGTVYRYFTDKVDVLACLLVRIEQELYASAVLPTDGSGRFEPDGAALAYFAVHRRHAGVFRAWREIAVAGGSLADAWISMRKEFARGIEGVVRMGQDRGTADPAHDPALVGDLVVAMFEQPAHTIQELGWDDQITDRDVVAVITAVLGDGLRPVSR